MTPTHPTQASEGDRELLELAARASGLQLTWGEKYKLGEDEIDCTDLPYVVGGSPDVGPAYWNPLEDDGDALRLAVKLRIDLDLWISNDRVTAWNHLRGGISLAETPAPEIAAHHHEPRGADEMAATRRAIVRAAAAIARATSLPNETNHE